MERKMQRKSVSIAPLSRETRTKQNMMKMGIQGHQIHILEVLSIVKTCEIENLKPHRSLFTFTWEAMQDVTFMILMECAAISMVLGTTIEGWPKGMYDGFGIILYILLVVMTMAINDYKQHLQFHDLNKQEKKTFIFVTRDGVRQKLSIYELVVGDVVHLHTGDQVPADGIYISGRDLLVDESSLTGEVDQ
ncbi:hypothetical protein ACSBR1_034798 [Camellia fascicularis]